MSTSRRPPLSFMIQFVVGFIIPTVILLTLSDESRLGPLWGMTLALVFPVALELYSVATGRKVGWVSTFSIIGILLIGVISVLGLSEEWLGVRRAAIYVIFAIAVAVILRFKRDWVDKGLDKVLDMPVIRSAAKKQNTEVELETLITKVGYILAFLLLAIGVWSYVLTIIVITAATGSSDFNAQYAELRVLSLPFVTLPLLIGTVALMMYLGIQIEKITGLEFDDFLKKKK